MEPVERIYCCDRDNNDNALAAAILANGNNRRDDWGPMAAMMSGGMTQGLIKIVCGKSNCYAINSSLTVSIAAPAA